jgi:hypothetical protein
MRCVCCCNSLLWQLLSGPLRASNGKVVRVIHAGRMLNDALTLDDAGLKDQSVVHCALSGE